MMMKLGPETSASQGLNHCNSCGACCRFAPCSLLPDDVARIEAHVGRSIKGDVRVGKSKAGELVVTMKPPCTFLDGNVCTIHDVKPTGAREFECWTPATLAKNYFWTRSALKRVFGFRV